MCMWRGGAERGGGYRMRPKMSEKRLQLSQEISTVNIDDKETNGYNYLCVEL